MYFRQIIFYFVVFLAGAMAGSLLNSVVSCYQQGISLQKLFKGRGETSLFNCYRQGTGPHNKACAASRNLSCFILVGLFSASIFVLCYHFFGLTLVFFKYVITLELLLAISVVDLKAGVIPDRFLLALFLWLLFWQVFYSHFPLGLAVGGFLVGGGIFYVIALLSKGGMGGGDIKLMAVLGFAAGWPAVLGVFLCSFILGAAVGAVLLLSKRKTLKDPLPFAPFLSLGFFLVAFWGLSIWQLYTSFW